MQPDHAVRALAPLVAATNGWTDDAIDIYTAELATIEQPHTLAEVCRTIARTWTAGWRPPLGTILDEYNKLAGRRSLAAVRALPSREECPTFAAGIAIAWREYSDGARRSGREPDRHVFDRWTSTAGQHATPVHNAILEHNQRGRP